MRQSKQSPYSKAEDFQQMYQQTHLGVFRYIYSLTSGPQEDVEDFTAETYMRAWRARNLFQDEQGKINSWLFRIAKNLVIDAYRKQKNVRYTQKPVEEFEIAIEQPNQETSLIIAEKIEVMQQVLQTLSLEQRELLGLRYVLGWRVKDIGEFLDIPENTVSVKIRRSLQKARQDWPQYKG